MKTKTTSQFSSSQHSRFSTRSRKPRVPAPEWGSHNARWLRSLSLSQGRTTVGAAVRTLVPPELGGNFRMGTSLYAELMSLRENQHERGERGGQAAAGSQWRIPDGRGSRYPRPSRPCCRLQQLQGQGRGKAKQPLQHLERLQARRWVEHYRATRHDAQKRACAGLRGVWRLRFGPRQKVPQAPSEGGKHLSSCGGEAICAMRGSAQQISEAPVGSEVHVRGVQDVQDIAL
jgi:hypothetical protein